MSSNVEMYESNINRHFGVDGERLRRMYRDMLRIRMTEESIADRYAEQEMRCPIHLSIGQEASAVGTCRALRRPDRVFSTHRCHAHYLAMEGDLGAMLAEIYGKATGCVGGRGGSMHLADPDKGMLASVPIVGSAIPLAVGTALADKIDGNDNVSVVFLGDASVEEGVFHESANFASLHKLPVLFVCENNMYSVYAPLKNRQPSRSMTELARAHGMDFASAEGNDVLAVFSAAREAVERARRGAGPTFLLFDTYRMREHCGPGFDNHVGYRSQEEYRSWQARCPIKSCQGELRNRNLLGIPEEDAWKAELRKEIEEAFKFAVAGSLPTPEQASAHVYA